MPLSLPVPHSLPSGLLFQGAQRTHCGLQPQGHKSESRWAGQEAGVQRPQLHKLASHQQPLQVHSGKVTNHRTTSMGTCSLQPKTYIPTSLHLDEGSLCLFYIDLGKYPCTRVLILFIYSCIFFSSKKYLLMPFYFQAFSKLLKCL